VADPLLPPDDDEPRAQPSLVPFLAAAAIVGVAVVLAFVFLRSDDDGRLVRPDRLDATGDDVVRAVVLDLPACEVVERAQVDVEDDRVLVELVAVAVPDDACADGEGREVVAEITLPVPLGDRALAAGVGRTPLPCTGDAAAPRCGPTP